MKARVTKTLTGGMYQISFAFSDFTQEELAKMRSFGVPVLQLRTGFPGSQSVINVPINQINANIVAGFVNEYEANNYETTVLTQAKTAMDEQR